MQSHADQPQQRRNVQVPTPKVEGSSSSGSFVKPQRTRIVQLSTLELSLQHFKRQLR
jgi:hypothetical protein